MSNVSRSKKQRPIRNKIPAVRCPSKFTTETIQRYYEALDCPRSLTCWLLFKYEEHKQLVDLECDPEAFSSASSFRDAYASTLFLKKSTFLKLDLDKKELALQKFKTFEGKCRQTNAYFARQSLGGNVFTANDALFEKMRWKIDDMLGEFSPCEMMDLGSWGPGVSTLVRGEETFAAKKFQFETGVTRDLYPLVKALLPFAYPTWWENLGWSDSSDSTSPNFRSEKVGTGAPTFQVGNKVITVPKTSKIDRVIAVEPGFNLWFQLAVGRLIRKRLLKHRIDLSNQTTNQKLSRSASVNNKLATIDMSSASDSISSRFVESLFSGFHSNRWFEVMDVMRSKYGLLQGKVVRWEKFSSMGNGFTFDLETLIFYAAAWAVVSSQGGNVEDISIYGDDIIIPRESYATFSSLCEYCGFIVNPDKSFTSGYFRESCGAHYYRGVDCKPVYLVDMLTSYSQVTNFANTVRLRAHDPQNGFCDARFRRLFYWMQNEFPRKYREFRTTVSVDEYGTTSPVDGGWISNYDEAVPSIRRGRSELISNAPLPTHWEGFSYKRIASVAIEVEVDYPGLLLARLSSRSVEQSYGNFCSLRDRTKQAVVSSFARQWYNLGPWL